MDSQRWRQIEAVLDQVLETPVEDRAEILDRACGEDAELRAEVESLLAADRDGTGLLESPAADYAATLLDVDRTVAEDELEGRELGPYRVLRRLGGGGMGVVYEAEDTRLGRRVAIKLLPSEWSRHPGSKERFLREARAASGIDHPNVCTIHDLGESDGGRLFLVMALARGETLQQRLENEPLPVTEARDLAVQIARGLEPAHAAGIVHRDVKPANVMVAETDDGPEAKILDFGIAKIAGEAGLTQTGGSLGTPYYMSPEQAAGQPVDARTDVWSLGVVLYEMLAGRRPFEGDNQLAVLRAITDSDLEPLDRLRPQVPESLGRTVEKALAKDPAERYQTVAELRADLESNQVSPVAARRRSWLLAMTVIALLALAGWWTWRSRPATTSEPSVQVVAGAGADATAAEAQRTKLAVLFFQNLTGDPDLDWMRRGITEMLVTDLAQSPELDVVSTRRLFEIFGELGLDDPSPPSLETVRAVADKSGAGTIVLGNFVRLGEVLQVAFSVERPTDGEILQSDRFEGRGDESLFAVVDELSAAIRNRFEVAPHPAGAPTVEDVTTSSIEAWRHYTEGLALYQQAKFSEAVPLLEKAVEIDPEFALALSTLGRLYQNLRQPLLEREFKRRAVEHADRLPTDRRYAVQGTFYSSEWTTYGQAIAAFRRAVELYPDRTAHRSNLAAFLMFQEHYEAALEHYEILLRQGTQFAPTYSAAANAYAALGRLEIGRRLLEDLVARSPEQWYPHLGLAWYLTIGDEPAAATAALERAAALRPGESNVEYAGWRLEVSRENWPQAAIRAQNLLDSDDTHARWLGATSAARNLLYKGQSEAALERFRQATRAYPEPESFTALAHAWSAELLLARGEPRQALREARLAQELGAGQWPEILGLFLAASAELDLGLDASESETRLRQLWASNPNPVEERQLHRLAARRSAAAGEHRKAVEALLKAEALLPARGTEMHWHVLPDHVPLWFELGLAEVQAGRQEQALHWFEAVAESGDEHIQFPIPWVRGFYHLGQVQHQLGDEAQARRQLSRFVELWGSGDLDLRKLEEAAEAANRP